MEFVLASIPTIQLEALIKLLLSACAVTANGSTNKDLKTLATSVMSGAKRAEASMVVDCTHLLMEIVKGNEVDFDELKQAMKGLRQAIREEIKSDAKFDHRTLDVLNASTAYLINNGEPALRKMRAIVNEMHNPVLTKEFAPEAASQKDFIRPLERIVQTVSKKKGTTLDAESLAKLKAKNPDVFREYQRLRKGYNQVWKDEINAFIAKSGKKAVPYADLIQFLNGKKIEHPLQEGFKGLMDANGKAYTTTGKAINGGIPLKNSGFTIKMNPEYNPKVDDQYVFTTLKDGKTSQHVYTVDYRKSANKQKFEKVHDLMAVIDKVHQTWQPYLKRGDMTKQCVAATVLEIMYQFSARIGTKGNKTLTDSGRSVSTFGISTLEVRHVKVNGNNILLQYPGKDNVRQSHLINGSASIQAKSLVKNLKLFVSGRAAQDRVFQYEKPNGRLVPIKNGEVNGTFRRLGAPQDSTVHKLRHVKGTELFLDQVAKNQALIKKGMDQAKADALFKQMATQVGALLGHVRGVGKQQKVTPATAIGNYIDPGVMLSYYDTLGLRPPKGLEKIRKQNGS